MTLEWGVEIFQPGREALEWYHTEDEAQGRRAELHRGGVKAYVVNESRLRVDYDPYEDEDADLLEVA